MTGLIPADAGNTSVMDTTASHYSAHPRGRGEHGGDGDYGYPLLGSSPRTRGTPNAEHVLRGMTGLIPADAGHTSVLDTTAAHYSAQPRGRGEPGAVLGDLHALGGASPRTRGTLFATRAVDGSVGLIPADAGNTGPSSVTFTRSGAHPRGRGEHCLQHAQLTAVLGSSPRTRGTLR